LYCCALLTFCGGSHLSSAADCGYAGKLQLLTSGSDVEGTQYKLVPFPVDSLDRFVAKLGQSSRQILQVDLKSFSNCLDSGVVALLTLSGCDPFRQEDLVSDCV
jgi:hypothetical protein